MEIINRLLQTYGTNNPSIIADANEIMVLYENLDMNTWGYYTCIRRIPIIHINRLLDGFQRVFALGHELGHHFLHAGINTPFLKRNTLFSVDRIERQANVFSLHLIVGFERPDFGETKSQFLKRCGIPEEFHIFY